jgi:CHASE3 domain sensor protein
MTEQRSLSAIAHEIRNDWGRNINRAARSYLDAMSVMDSMIDVYVCDDAASIVSYFLSNAATWHGPVAKRIKAELRAML